MKWRNTYRKLNAVGDILIKGLQDTLRVQKHNATNALSRTLPSHLVDASAYQFPVEASSQEPETFIDCHVPEPSLNRTS